jgi:hypothetical protein
MPFVLLALGIETVLVLALLMPIATTVVWYHSSFRRRRLLVVLLAGLTSTLASLAYVAQRREPIVSYATRERVRLRTAAAPRRAHRALRKALTAALPEAVKATGVEGDGKVMGPALERARAALEEFYKHDEGFAFDLWASPRQKPRVLVIYFEARPHKPPIWVAMSRSGSEIRASNELPPGAFRAMRRAADEDDAALWDWSDELSFEDDDQVSAQRRGRTRSRAVLSATPSASPAQSAGPSAPVPPQ